MPQPSREHFRSLNQKFVIKAKCFSWQNLLKYHPFYSLQHKARLPYTIDLGSTTGTGLSMYHRKHTLVTHRPHLQELEKLYSEQFFTKILLSKITCRDFHCIFRMHWIESPRSWHCRRCEVSVPVTSSHSCTNNPSPMQSTAAEGNALAQVQCGLWGQQNKHTALFTSENLYIKEENHVFKKHCLAFFSIWISVFTLTNF